MPEPKPQPDTRAVPVCTRYSCWRTPLKRMTKGDVNQTATGFYEILISGWYCPRCGGGYGGTPPRTDQPIERKIESAVIDHAANTGKHPTKLYLGRSEWEELKEYARNVCDFRMEADASGERRPEYRGSKIYRVDDEHYIGVGL